MSKILGISLCTEISFTKPLIAPNVDISLIKSDKSMKSFELSFEAPDETSSEKKSWKLSLNTPNTRINRQFSAEVQTINPIKGKKRVQIDINTPWNGMQASASIRNDQNVHEIKFHIKNNEETQLLFDVGLEKQIKEQSIEYKPQLKLKTWNSEKDELSVSGTISLDNDEYTNEIDIDSYRVRRDVQDVDNEIDSNPSIVSTNLNLKIFALDANIKATLDKSKRSADIVIEYNLEQLSKESVKLSAKVSKDNTEQKRSKSVTLQLTLSQFPEYNAQLTYGKTYENNRLRDLEVELLWNEQLKDKLHIRRSVKYTEGAHDFERQANWIIEITPLEINYEVQLNGIHDNNEADNSRLYNVDISVTDLNEKENILTGSMNVKANKHVLSNEQSHRKIESLLTLSGPLIEDYPRFKKIDTQIEYTSGKELQIKIKSPVRLLIGTITREVSDNNSVGLNAKITETRDTVTRDLLNSRLRYQLQPNRTFLNELIIETNFKNTPQTLKINQKFDMDYEDDKKVDMTVLTSIESTRIPQLNAKFYYTLNAERRKHIADEFLLAWGKQLNNKFNIKREVNMTNENNFVEVTERASVIATPLDIDYVVNEHALVRIVPEGVTNFQFHISKKDRTGRHSDRDYSAGIDFERNLSSELASGSLNASLKYRKRDLHYRETWQLIGGTERKGHIYVQWEEGKYSNVDYSLLFERKQLKKKETQTTIDINIKRQRWYEEQPKEFRGTITRFIIADKEQIKFNLESNNGVALKGDIIKKGDRASRKEVSLTYDINFQCPQHLEFKVAGKQRRVPKSHISSDLSIDYKWKDNERQSIKAATRGQMVVSYTLINVTAKSEFKCTQFPQYNYVFDWQTLYKLYQRFVQNELTVAWSEDIDDNRVHVYYENIDTVPQEKQKFSNGQLTIDAKPLGIEYEFKISSNITRRDDFIISDFRQEIVGKNKTTGHRGLNSLIEYQNQEGNKTANIFVRLHSPSRQWSRVANVSVRAVRDIVVEDLLVNYRMQNNRTNAYLNLDAQLFRTKPCRVSLQVPYFDLTLINNKESTDEKTARIEFVGKDNRMPIKYTGDLTANIRDRKFFYRSQTEKLNFPQTGGNQLIIAVYSQLLYRTRVEYQYRKRLQVEVESEPYLHKTEVIYANFPAVSLQTSTTRNGDNVLNVTTTLSADLALKLDILSKEIRVLLELDPTRRIVNFDIQNP